MTAATTAIAASLFGALTTQFAPPTTCFQNYYEGPNILLPQLGENDIYGIWHEECYPPNFNPERMALIGGWFSPGVCPSNYFAAIISTMPDAALQSQYTGILSFSASAISDETTVLCCPTGHAPIRMDDSDCKATKLNLVVTTCATSYPPRTSSINPSLGTVVFDTCTSTGVTTLSAPIEVIGHGIYVKYRPSDLPILQKASSGWGQWPGITAPSTSTTSTDSSGTSSASSPGDSRGLSQDAKIAIGVAVPVIFIAFVLGLFAAMRWRKRSNKDPPAMPELESTQDPTQATVSSYFQPVRSGLAEMSVEKTLVHDPRYDRPLEMDAQGYKAELEGQGRFHPRELQG